MKIKIAVFHSRGFTSVLRCEADGKSLADQNSDYVRATESVDVELPDLPREEIVAARLGALDATEKKLKAEFSREIDRLQDEREKLLALPAA